MVSTHIVFAPAKVDAVGDGISATCRASAPDRGPR